MLYTIKGEGSDNLQNQNLLKKSRYCSVIERQLIILRNLIFSYPSMISCVNNNITLSTNDELLTYKLITTHCITWKIQHKGDKCSIQFVFVKNNVEKNNNKESNSRSFTEFTSQKGEKTPIYLFNIMTPILIKVTG